MKINKLVLNNIGPFFGENELDFKPRDKKNLVLVGGKNGAGKTTIFSSMRLALYGHKDRGCDSINHKYKKQVLELINEESKREENSIASVELHFSINDGSAENVYIIKRTWNLRNQDFEEFSVIKNNLILSDEELLDFEQYILSLIPPDLLNLYFFDGEEIVDFLFGDESSGNLRHAFLVICGFDVFQILLKNFRRITLKNNKTSIDMKKYIEYKELYTEQKEKLDVINDSISSLKKQLSEKKSLLKRNETNFIKKGGKSDQESYELEIRYNELENELKKLNIKKKKILNEVMPFLINKELVNVIVNKLESEKNSINSNIIKDFINSDLKRTLKSKNVLNDEISDILNGILVEYTSDEESIFKYSMSELDSAIVQFNSALSFNNEEVNEIVIRSEEIQNERKELRRIQEINKGNLFLDYSMKKGLVERDILLITDAMEQFNTEQIKEASLLDIYKKEYDSLKEKVSEEFRNESITELSTRGILMIEQLLEELLEKQLRKVEKEFMVKIKKLARKNNFITNIHIDSNFNISIYKKDTVKLSKIKAYISRYSAETFIKNNDEIYCNSILRSLKIKSLNDVLNIDGDKSVRVLQEINKNQLSKGEQQIFTMCLYWSIMTLSNKEIPFFIDTPFARIDAEHRTNITNEFFNKLTGQLYIFSTNEEIIGEHLDILSDRICSKFLLENQKNIRTTLKKNKYFEEN